MAHSLGLSLYTLASRREAAPQTRPPRPGGPLVWLHAPDPDNAGTVTELARRVEEELGHAVLLTGAPPVRATTALHVPLGDDTPADAAGFLDHFRPDLAVFAGAEVRPALVAALQDRGTPMMMVEAGLPHLPEGRRRWPGLMRGALHPFAHILTLDEAAARAFRRLGAAQVKVAGRMEEPHLVLPCTEAERAEITRAIAGRPVWLAAALPEAEEDAILAAHRSALHLSHRLLLIVVPQNPDRAHALAQKMEAAGLACAARFDEDEIQPETEVYMADNPDEFGLWYRLAPICYLGGSLTEGVIRDPLEAAGLGSALIHGPKTGNFGSTFQRLIARKATRPIAQAKALSDALADLLSPERVARLAGEAWDVASDGSEVTDRVLALVERMMDER
ncbi:3-deoxy-D-manno-octulosonic acid transferase [Falsirhodobacter sp. 20TX0035]|uniref:3-deoxy-D-manno-octulosonic acid transferase n=1 Tax=Falsirhodobacter sp. 20TX0035 TaxID=3022019 RepID=UPI0023311051|nr:glycosyltransferase N-terminal domain-containing protein [Falsirhodobacter sp. 20TX0035]MDB6452565.1 glycosyltransferase N-terminal domain-containing protein [Falsirhodobacter sp. 20TX0035]